MNKRTFTIKVWTKEKLVARCRTKSIRRAVDRLQRANFLKRDCRVYVRVSYGDGYYNCGYYTTRKDLNLAWQAFIEPG